MMRGLRLLRRDRKGASALEFALVLPLLVVLIVGIAQMGMLYFAHSGLRHLVGEASRFASITPRPTDSAIKARISAGGFGLQPAKLKAPIVTYGKTGGTDWADITAEYEVELDFIFWEIGPFNIEETRRVFIYPA